MALAKKIRYGSGFRKAISYLSNDNSHPELIAHLLTVALKNAATTPYWSSNLEGNSLYATDALEVLATLPITSRETLSLESRRMVTPQNLGKVDYISTSGSSGSSISFYLDKYRQGVEWAYVTTAWKAVGYRIGDWRVVFRGFTHLESEEFEINHVHRELRVSAGLGYNPELFRNVFEIQKEMGIRFLHGYPSSLSLYARYLKSQGLDLRVHGVMLVSEPVEHADIHALKATWPECKVTSHYGLSEKTAFGYALDEAQKRYRMDSTYGICEVLDDFGNHVKPGERGRLVTTRLQFQKSSLVRYDTGDSAKYIGGGWPVSFSEPLLVEEIKPRRILEYLDCEFGCVHPISTLIQTQSDFFTNNVDEYQIVNLKPSLVTFKFTSRAQAITEREIIDFRELLAKKLGSHFSVQVEKVNGITKSKSSKRILVVKN